MDRLSEKEEEMNSGKKKENLVYQKVSYSIYMDGQFIVVENVPARVDIETGEQYFSPDTVEHLHKIIKQKTEPVRTIQTPVYHYP